MKASDLVTVWSAPDNSRLTVKQYSFRLPVHIAAKLSALEDLYPTKSRTQLVGDLLTAAIAGVEQSLPSRPGKFWANDLKPKGWRQIFENCQISTIKQ